MYFYRGPVLLSFFFTTVWGVLFVGVIVFVFHHIKMGSCSVQRSPRRGFSYFYLIVLVRGFEFLFLLFILTTTIIYITNKNALCFLSSLAALFLAVLSLYMYVKAASARAELFVFDTTK